MPKATLVVFSGDLDKAYAALVIAAGAAASGWDVTLFFTFWGINLMRESKARMRKKRIKLKKDFMSKMFASMMPQGVDELKLSQMHMLGMGSSMMRKRMKAKKVPSLDQFIKDAKELDVKFLVCDMSMDVMGLQKKEFISAVDDIVGVGTYVKESKDADMTLFI